MRHGFAAMNGVHDIGPMMPDSDDFVLSHPVVDQTCLSRGRTFS